MASWRSGAAGCALDAVEEPARGEPFVAVYEGALVDEPPADAAPFVGANAANEGAALEGRGLAED